MRPGIITERARAAAGQGRAQPIAGPFVTCTHWGSSCSSGALRPAAMPAPWQDARGLVAAPAHCRRRAGTAPVRSGAGCRDGPSPPGSCWVTAPWLAGVSWSILGAGVQISPRGHGTTALRAPRNRPARSSRVGAAWSGGKVLGPEEGGVGQRGGEQCGSRWDGVSRAVLCPEMPERFVCRPDPCLHPASRGVSSHWQGSGQAVAVIVL